MSKLKDDIVNKAIKFTRGWRPIVVDRDSNLIKCPNIWFDTEEVNYRDLIDLCLSIQKFLYGEEEDESNEHKNGEDIQSGKD